MRLHDLATAVERRLAEYFGRHLDAIRITTHASERRIIDAMTAMTDRFTADIAALGTRIDTMATDLASAKADAQAAKDQLATARAASDDEGMTAGLVSLEAAIGKLDTLHAGMTAVVVPQAPAAEASSAPVAAPVIADPAAASVTGVEIAPTAEVPSQVLPAGAEPTVTADGTVAATVTPAAEPAPTSVATDATGA